MDFLKAIVRIGGTTLVGDIVWMQDVRSVMDAIIHSYKTCIKDDETELAFEYVMSVLEASRKLTRYKNSRKL